MTAPGALDLASQPHLQGLFAPQVGELDVHDLRVEGELPVVIDGSYVRNGPNPRFTPLGRYLYPLDGDGMVHRVHISAGRAGYTNRFVRTPALVAEEAAGRALWPGIADSACTPGAQLVGPALAHTFKDLPGINVVRHGGKLLALAESANPFLLSADLATVGRETFCGMLPAGITAHPKIDPLTGEMVVFCYGLDAPYLTWSVIAPNGDVVRAATPVDGLTRPTMIHDMGLTSTYVVLVVAPFYFDLAAAAAGAGSPMSWQPEHGTRIALIPRDGSAVRWFHTDAFWLWHTANAYDSGAGVVLDYVRHDAPGGLVPNLRSAVTLARLQLDPPSGAIAHETLDGRGMEFPRIDDRDIAHQHRVIATSMRSGPHPRLPGDADTLAWYDTAAQELTSWSAEHLAVGEQTFIPHPDHDNHLHGWWATFATDRNDLTSKLLIIRAEDPTAGPAATIDLPQRIPLGLHGAWLPAQD